ncbi:TPA: DUF4062 domain-containing protein [Legionella pneumophila]|nr:DUF4062 domain-containing protein [Legionella pneumophila]HAU1766665.1 DUF4062 domain-containing protein [Legionella pneumophila]
MNKRYQVFVSSTYSDLIEERKAISQALLQMDCIPTGMELFPAIDEEQFEFIKKIIDDSDYYLLIIGGRYGTLTNEGISYTEKEYNYALEKGLKVIALIHDKPDELPLKKSEPDESIRKKLESFRETVQQGRLVKFWNNPSELPGLVAISFSQTIKTYPAEGWVRASSLPNTENLIQLNELRNENEQLKSKLAHYQDSTPKINNIAGLDENYLLTGSKTMRYHVTSWSKEITWENLFKIFSPFLMEIPTQSTVKHILEKHFASDEKDIKRIDIDEQCFRTLSLQYKALGLVNINYSKAVNGSMYLFWSLTSSGQKLMSKLRAIKSNK